MSDAKTLKVAQLVTDAGTQARSTLRRDVIEEYAERLANESPQTPKDKRVPPIKVVTDGDIYWVTDGFHRVEAHKLNKYIDIDCVVTKGTLNDAILEATSANATHGLPRTTQDKRKAVKMILGLPGWAAKSDRAIAEHIGVSNTLVSDYRRDMAESEKPAETTGKDGKKRKAKPKKAKPKLLYDFKKYDTHWGPVTRGPDAVVAAYPDLKKSSEYTGCKNLLREYRKVWTALQAAAQKVTTA